MKRTDEQLRAVTAHDRDLCVDAGAGSGKTSVLVEHILHILERRDADLSEMVAITFTEKAAAEMKERLRAACRKKAPEDNPEHQTFWRAIERRVDSARISTIHAFCMALLKEHALSLGKDPDFGILSEPDSLLLREDVIEETLHELVEKCDRAAFRLATEFRFSDLASMLRTLLGDRSVIERIRDGRAFSDPRALFADWDLVYASEQDRAHRDFIEGDKFQAARHELADLSDACADAGDKREMLRVSLLEEMSRAIGAENPAVRKDALRAIVELNARGGSKGKWSSEDAYARIAEILKELRDAIKEASWTRPSPELERKAAELTCDLMHVYSHVRDALDRAKESRNALDFEDLIVQTAHMLRNDARGQDSVCARVARSIKHLMIDEFQDTDSLQLEIARLLAKSPQGPKLFIVGDAKQSIYYFRGAEVEVFRMAREEADEVVRMDTNFRTLPAVLHFVNTFFLRSNLLHEVEPEYMPMKVHRNPASDSRIEFLIPPAVDNGSKADYRDAEAALLARRIAALCAKEAPPTVFDPGQQSFRRAQFGDVAILLRAFSDVHRYERALREASVPFTVVAGVGFYERQEVIDILNLLTVLVDPWNELALLGWLRSPIVGLSDPALVRLCGGVERPLGLAAQFHGEGTCGDPVQDSRLLAARTLFEDLRAHGDLPLSEFIHYVIDRTRYEAILLGQFLGVQRASNIRKLAELAESFGSGGPPRLGAFVRYLSEASASVLREGEAAVETEGRHAVTIMSVHKSKGLEFPIVAVADMGRAVQQQSRVPMAYHRALGLAVKLTDDSGEVVSPGCLTAINARRKREELAEQARVLYVAMTRARDYLILSGPPDAGKGNSWFAAMHDTFGILDRADGDTFTGDGWTAHVRRTAQALPENAVAASDEPLPPVSALIARIAPPPPESWTPGVYAVTRVLEAFKEDSAEDEPEREEDHTRTRGAALRRGTLVHRFLELWDFTTAPDPLIENLVLAECALREDRLRLAADLHRVASALKSHEWGGRLARAAGLRKEVPFLLRLDNSLIRGTIDALLDDGSIVDYKTGLRTPGKDEVYRRQIQLYASAIRSLTGALPPAGYLLYLDGDHGLEVDSVDVSPPAVERTRAEAIDALRASAEAATGQAS